MVRKISVAPIEGGWIVRSDLAATPMMFLSAPQAERAARRLADRLSAAGEAVSVDVYLRDGALGARMLAPPASPARETAPASILWMTEAKSGELAAA